MHRINLTGCIFLIGAINKENKTFDSLLHATFPEGKLGTAHVRRNFPRIDFCSCTLQTLTSEKEYHLGHKLHRGTRMHGVRTLGDCSGDWRCCRDPDI